MDVFDHPAVVAAIEQLDRDLAPLIAVTRGNAVAVVLGDDRRELTVIIEQRDGGWPPPQLGWRSKMAGRAVQRTSSGTLLIEAARWSTNSSNPSSAQ
jgi:hypothetical protein